MTRVLFVIPSLGSGGAERSLAEELPGLLERGVDPAVACFHDRPGFRDEIEALGVPVHVLHGAWPTRLDGLRRMISATGPDVVHTSVIEADLLGRLAALSTRTPVVSTLVNTAYDDSRLKDPGVSRIALRAYRRADSWTARACVGHRAISESVKQSAVQQLRLTAEQIQVIPRGRDLAAYQFTAAERLKARSELGIAPNDYVVGNVARHEYQKGLDTLVEAMTRVQQSHPQVLLVQAGRSGNHEGAIQQALVHSSADVQRFRFLGFRADVATAVLPALDLFVFPSRYEGLGGAVVEALAAGLPIVASDIPALREVLGPAATYFPVGDAESLATAVGQAVAERKEPPLGQVRNQARAFDIQKVSDRVSDWLRTVIRSEEVRTSASRC